MDNKYQRGKIYTVRCLYDDKLIYVGSTTQKYLSVRMAKHRYYNQLCSLTQYVNGDWKNWYIELYEDYPCNSKQELEKREGEIIRQIGTINKRIEGRTAKERTEANKEQIAEYIKQYHQDNKEKISKKNKEYYQNNKEIIVEKFKQKGTCQNCGSIVRKGDIAKHKRTKKCLNYNICNN
jgi:predicted ATP-grasp superfamily ATP-dependent carboligase